MLKQKPSYWHVETGIIYSRLIETNITENIADASRQFAYKSIVDEFEKDDFSALIGLGYTWENGICFNFRYAISFNKFYKNEDFSPHVVGSPVAPEIEFLRNYFYSLSLSYTLFKRTTRKGKKSKRR